MCLWIKENLDKDTPLHFSRFFPAYRLTGLPATPIKKLEQAHNIARKVGLEYVTMCPAISTTLHFAPAARGD